MRRKPVGKVKQSPLVHYYNVSDMVQRGNRYSKIILPSYSKLVYNCLSIYKHRGANKDLRNC